MCALIRDRQPTGFARPAETSDVYLESKPSDSSREISKSLYYESQVRGMYYTRCALIRDCQPTAWDQGGPDELSSLRNNHMTILHSSLHMYIHAVHDLHCIPRYISTYT